MTGVLGILLAIGLFCAEDHTSSRHLLGAPPIGFVSSKTTSLTHGKVDFLDDEVTARTGGVGGGDLK